MNSGGASFRLWCSAAPLRPSSPPPPSSTPAARPLPLPRLGTSHRVNHAASRHQSVDPIVTSENQRARHHKCRPSFLSPPSSASLLISPLGGPLVSFRVERSREADYLGFKRISGGRCWKRCCRRGWSRCWCHRNLRLQWYVVSNPFRSRFRSLPCLSYIVLPGGLG